MGLSNLYDQKVPVLDAWTSFPLPQGLRLSYSGSITGGGGTSSVPLERHSLTTLSGYSISCYPSHQLLGATPALMQGRNLYAQLITHIRTTLPVGSNLQARMYVEPDTRGRWQVTIGIADPTIKLDSLELTMPLAYGNSHSLAEYGDGTRWLSPEWLGFEPGNVNSTSSIVFTRSTHPKGGDGMYATTVYGTVGSWQPEHMGWTTVSDRTVNYRVAASPFSQRYETRLNWGQIDTKTLRLEMVHAADVMRDRNADIPCLGWAAAAHTAPLRGQTLERILPWWTRARPQMNPSTSTVGDNSFWHKDGVEKDVDFDPASIPGLVAWFPVRSALNSDPGAEGMFSEVSSIAGSHPGLKITMGAPAHRGYAGWQRTSMAEIMGVTSMDQFSIYCNSPSLDSIDAGYTPTVMEMQYSAAPSNRRVAYMSAAGVTFLTLPESLSISDPFTSEPAPNNILFSDYIAFEATNGDQSASLDRKLYMRGRTVNASSVDIFNWSTQNMQFFFPAIDKNRTVYDKQMTLGDVFIFNRHLTDVEHYNLMAWLYEYAHLNYGDS